ncbi:MAG: hypothetical protein M3137_03480 [Actinomycetota bacterium]|nr:hypothetical protein [Actinomycetota bacterium]
MVATKYALASPVYTSAAGATVLENYTIKREFVSDDASVVSRDDPRIKVRLLPRFLRLAPVVEEVFALMGKNEGCATRPAVEAALRFLNLHGSTLRLPAVTGTARGVQLEWFRQGFGVELEFDADGDLIALTDDGSDVRSEIIEDDSHPFLHTVLAAICDG